MTERYRPGQNGELREVSGVVDDEFIYRNFRALFEENVGALLPFGEIYETVWGDTFGYDSMTVIRTQVSLMRRSLPESRSLYSLRAYGYVLGNKLDSGETFRCLRNRLIAVEELDQGLELSELMPLLETVQVGETSSVRAMGTVQDCFLAYLMKQYPEFAQKDLFGGFVRDSTNMLAEPTGAWWWTVKSRVDARVREFGFGIEEEDGAYRLTGGLDASG